MSKYDQFPYKYEHNGLSVEITEINDVPISFYRAMEQLGNGEVEDMFDSNGDFNES